jgi:hypothetical protein
MAKSGRRSLLSTDSEDYNEMNLLPRRRISTADDDEMSTEISSYPAPRYDVPDYYGRRPSVATILLKNLRKKKTIKGATVEKNEASLPKGDGGDNYNAIALGLFKSNRIMSSKGHPSVEEVSVFACYTL